MDSHGHKSIPSIEIGQVWGYCRDNLKGTTPLAQEHIDCLKRDYLAPSKAHIKRLHKQRPLVLRKRNTPPVVSRDVRHFNYAHALGEHSKLRNLRAAYGTAHGEGILAPPKPPKPVQFDYTRNASVPPDRDNWEHSHWEAESERLGREMKQAWENRRG